jgi:thiol-disulfide isomerase/thioredoxin
MKNLLFMCFLVPVIGFSQGMEFYEGDWKEALKQADKEGKLVFVDAYAVWCGPCKLMSKNVFPQAKVGEFYNANFINLKIDMERGQGLEFRKKYPVRAFPTYFYLDPSGKIVHTTKGAKRPDDFIKVGALAVRKYDKSATYADQYNEGDRSPQLVYDYVKALKKSGKPSLKIANDYLNSQKDLTTPENLKFILLAASEADSRIFSMLEENKEELIKLVSIEEVESSIRSACQNTFKKSLEYNSIELLHESQNKMTQHLPNEAMYFKYKSNLDYFSNTSDEKNYLKTAKVYFKKVVKNDASQMLELMDEIVETFGQSKSLLDLGSKIGKKAIEFGGQSSHYMTFAKILHLQGNKVEALEAAKKAKVIARERKEKINGIQKLIDELS